MHGKVWKSKRGRKRGGGGSSNVSIRDLTHAVLDKRERGAKEMKLALESFDNFNAMLVRLTEQADCDAGQFETAKEPDPYQRRTKYWLRCSKCRATWVVYDDFLENHALFELRQDFMEFIEAHRDCDGVKPLNLTVTGFKKVPEPQFPNSEPIPLRPKRAIKL